MEFFKYFFCYCILYFVSFSSTYSLVWPTANPAFSLGKTIDSFVQPTSYNNPLSGTYGLVRRNENGKKFHEGLDLFGLNFDKDGEVTDSIFSILDGTIVHINSFENRSSYGRYVVISHSMYGLSFYSLYAHLHSINDSIRLNHPIKEGDCVGRMGRSAGGYKISKSNAHLHFEIGFQYMTDFDSWYENQKFKTPNCHNDWNGLNLFGVDPLGFYRFVQSTKEQNFLKYIMSFPVIIEVHIKYFGYPQFLRKNPAFCQLGLNSNSMISGWKIGFNEQGVPVKWEPLKDAEADLLQLKKFKIIRVSDSKPDPLLPSLFYFKDGKPIASKKLQIKLEKLFHN